MTITVTRDRTGKMRHVVAVRGHRVTVDELPAVGGEDTGPTPHDLYDAALGACKALTIVWYANRKQIPLEDVTVAVERDDADERSGTYRLRTTLTLGGALSDAQREELRNVAGEMPGAPADDAGHDRGHDRARCRRSPCQSSRFSQPRAKDLGGGFLVRRLLPAFAAARRRPVRVLRSLRPGHGAARRTTSTCGRIRTSGSPPSPTCSKARCCIATAWASVQRIEPGAINWMTAGRGIVHSERTPPDLPTRDVHRARTAAVGGAAAAPSRKREPAFAHTPAAAIPALARSTG